MHQCHIRARKILKTENPENYEDDNIIFESYGIQLGYSKVCVT